MKHKVFGRKLGRDIKERKALFRSLTQALIEHGQITTTIAKAKAVRGQIEKMVTKAKKGTTASLREVSSFVNNPRLEKKLISDIAPMFQSPGGYTRMYRVGVRAGDHAQQVILQWVKKAQEAIIPEVVKEEAPIIAVQEPKEEKPKKSVKKKSADVSSS